MRKHAIKKQKLRKNRAHRVRHKMHGTKECPRLSVHKTNSNIYAQLIDDENGVVLGASGTLSKAFQDTPFSKKSKESAKKIGETIAEIAKKQNIESVIFDRGPFKYHGILAELADAARAQGLKF
ncbi:MAG: 50S ribosomal protein L18 [Chlamydiia bacterium]|nr:50S ribosomal protein L18 [Chlamydiia bacterium]